MVFGSKRVPSTFLPARSFIGRGKSAGLSRSAGFSGLRWGEQWKPNSKNSSVVGIALSSLVSEPLLGAALVLAPLLLLLELLCV